MNLAGHTFLIFSQQKAKQAQTLTRYAIQNETKRDISTSSPHSKQNKRFLATTTALNTNETSKYTYELLLTSADKDCFSQRVFLYSFLLALEHTFHIFSQQKAKQAQTLTRYAIQNETKRDISTSIMDIVWLEGRKDGRKNE